MSRGNWVELQYDTEAEGTFHNIVTIHCRLLSSDTSVRIKLDFSDVILNRLSADH